MQCNDIYITPQFVRDFDKAPKEIQSRVNALLRRASTYRKLTNGFKPHRAVGHRDIWIGYVTRSGEHWRVLFDYMENQPFVLVFDRLVPHTEMDRILKPK